MKIQNILIQGIQIWKNRLCTDATQLKKQISQSDNLFVYTFQIKETQTIKRITMLTKLGVQIIPRATMFSFYSHGYCCKIKQTFFWSKVIFCFKFNLDHIHSPNGNIKQSLFSSLCNLLQLSISILSNSTYTGLFCSSDATCNQGNSPLLQGTRMDL